MSARKDLPTENSHGELCRVEKEQLSGSDTRLTSFFFNQGSNIYVFSYEKEGMRRHTFIDAGDLRYRNEILPILIENDINPANIDRIIVTHRHPDHIGLAALLAKESKATIVVHPNFRSFIQGKTEEQRWLGNGALSQLRDRNIEYLPQPSSRDVKRISGVDFPIFKSIEIGAVGLLMILACPESTPTHSPDQIIVLYSPTNSPQTHERTNKDSRPTDNILFSGDLWLMRGPVRDLGARNLSLYFRYGFYRMKNLFRGKSMHWRGSREQDSKAKEALKRGFHLIRVNPGHGDAFIGSSIIPFGLLADRDLLRGLGYSLDANKAILKQRALAPKIMALKEQAYSSFIKEILFWKELGYTSGEILALLVRIYKEQSGGGALAAEDRKQRRKGLKTTLTRLKDDKAKSEELHQLAGAILLELKRVS